jgi:hypothetical protein
VKVSYDPECEKLARYFLGIDALYAEADVTALAGTIQRAIEDWLEDREEGRTPTEPDDVSGQGEER